jgi:hypothetical protein
MHRGCRALRRVVSAVSAGAVIGAGALAAAPASAGTPRTDGATVQGRPGGVLAGTWEGSYTCGQGLTGLDLRIQRPGPRGSLQATFSFYPLTKNPAVPVGVFTMRGTYHSATRIVLRYRRWILRPAGYFMASLSGRLTAGRFHGAVHIGPGGAPCTTFSARKLAHTPTRRAVLGTWKGSYQGCAQGPTGLTLAIKPRGATGNRLRATFSFHALPTNPGVPSGSYAMTGFYFPGGVALDQSHWIIQPPGYGMVNLVGSPPRGRSWNGVIVDCSTFSVRKKS